MNRTLNLIAPLFIIAVLFTGCSKEKQTPSQPANSVKITLVSGGGQTDTIGKPLANAIVVKVTQNNNPVGNYTVAFQGSGCNSGEVDQFYTGADGTTSYNWYLAGDVGQQTLKAFVLNSQNQKVDSVTVTATGLQPGPGWHKGACTIPFGFIPTNLCKLSTGRLLTAMGAGKAYLRYSDDNGVSWNALKTAVADEYEYIFATPSDEVYTFVYNKGTNYSSDGGQTWSTLPVQPFNSETINAMGYAPGGQLIITTGGNVYVSSDKGNTWTKAPLTGLTPPNSTGPDGDFGSPTGDLSGNLYVIGIETGTIYKSADKGVSWAYVPKSVQEQDFSFFIDNNGWFYKSRQDPQGGIFISKDNGNTYSTLVSSPNTFMDDVSVQSDGNLYFNLLATLGGGFSTYNSTAHSYKVLFINDSMVSEPYIVAKNNNILTVNPEAGWIYYYSH